MVFRDKFLISAWVLCFLNAFAWGQVSVTEIAQPKPRNTRNYDSTVNFLGKNVDLYVGQTLHVIPLKPNERKDGYDGFVGKYVKFDRMKANAYKCCTKLYNNTEHDSLAGRNFRVLAVKPEPPTFDPHPNIRYLQLLNEKTRDTLYYEYDMLSNGGDFPFLVLGYHEKMKQKFVGKEFMSRYSKFDHYAFNHGEILKVVDLTLDGSTYELKCLVNTARGRALIAPSNLMDEQYFVNKAKADAIKSRYGLANLLFILRGEVQKGWTREMCLESLGQPRSVVEVRVRGKKYEKWVYDERCYFFRDNVVRDDVQ